jgi:hypothetical protein
MSNMQILTESEAVAKIVAALEGMDIDDLAWIVSLVAVDGRVIVTHDGNEGMTAEQIIEADLPYSDVCENGEMIGYMDENLEVIEIGDRYQLGQPCNEQDVGEFLTAIENKAMLPIIDDSQGKTVAWVYSDESHIVEYINSGVNNGF